MNRPPIRQLPPLSDRPMAQRTAGTFDERAPLPPAEALLATELSRMAREVVVGPAPTATVIRAAAVVAAEAARLVPEDEAAQRLALSAARLAEDDAAIDAALSRVLELDPDDDVAQLLRLLRAADVRFQLVEERDAFYVHLIQAAQDDRLGQAAGSRIAFDLALLRQRREDLDGFVEALVQAMELDTSNVPAARTAVEFLQRRTASATDRAELLMNLVLADPTEGAAIEALARLLLQEGAYVGASRLYSTGLNIYDGWRAETPGNLVADLAIARWASGSPQGAVSALTQRERDLAVRLELAIAQRARAEDREPGSTVNLEPLPKRAGLPPAAAAVRLAIVRLEGAGVSPGRRAVDEDVPLDVELAEELMGDYDRYIAGLRSAGAKPIDVAAAQLDQAWLAVWLARDGERCEQLVADASTAFELTEEAAARFAGWIAVRRDDWDAAEAAFADLLATDPLARLGQATLLELRGEPEAARGELRAVAVQARGTLAGTWAQARLLGLAGERIAPTPDAARLEGLIATIPPAFDVMAVDRSTAVQLRVSVPKRTVGPFQPLIVRVEVSNNAPVALALSSEGPIFPTVILEPSVNVTVNGETRENRQRLVVDLGRRIRLEPRERLVVDVDLRRHPMGRTLNREAVEGGFVQVRGLINHRVGAGAVFVPGPLGSEDSGPVMRIDGIRMSDPAPEGEMPRLSQSFRDRIRRAGDATNGRDVMRDLGVVHQFAVQEFADPNELIRALQADCGNAMVSAWPTLDPQVQAWLLLTVPRTRALEPIVERVQRSNARLVRLAWLLNHVTRRDDPVLQEELGGDDITLRRVAEAVESELRRTGIGQ
ncbi:MAG: hypothetical protein AB8G96_03610 [Phycisphaerales bacterium]